jgi:hypothetical protein
VAIAFNKNPTSVFEHIIDITLFRGEKGVASPYDIIPTETMSVHYGLQESTLVRYIDLPNSNDFCHTQVINNNSFCPPFGENNLSWIGIAAGISENILNIVNQIKIYTRNGYATPFYSKIS